MRLLIPVAAFLLSLPGVALAADTVVGGPTSTTVVNGSTTTTTDNTTGCTALAQAAAAGMAAQISADDQSIKAPQSVTQLTCLSNFFNGVGLNVLTNLLDPSSLLKAVEGQICSTVQSAWQSAIGSAQCGLTVTGFNIGFGGLGGGLLCPKLTFGGGGTAIGGIGTNIGSGSGGYYLNGQAQGPTGYSLPPSGNY